MDIFKRKIIDTYGQRKYELKATLANYKQGEDFVNVYYSRLKTLWDESENYTKFPHCQITPIKGKGRIKYLSILLWD